jgi:hypothetical protein
VFRKPFAWGLPGACHLLPHGRGELALESWLAWEFWLGEVGPVGFRAQQPISTILQGGWALENSWPLSVL